MFEDYLQDSYEFYSIGLELSKKNDERAARRYFRASVFYAASAIESFVNYIGGSFEKANSLEEYETNYLNDKISIYSPRKGLKKKTEYHSVDEKLYLLLIKFSPDYDFGGLDWYKFKELKEFRDSLVHPRSSDDDVSLADYIKFLLCGLASIIHIMDYLSKGIFKRPLRKQLLDLIPE